MQIKLIDKQECIIDEVIKLVSFDKLHFCADTKKGIVIVNGENIEIENIDNQESVIKISGIIKSIMFDNVVKKKKKRNFIKKLFK